MAERCPLVAGWLYTDTEDASTRIPEICLRQCESEWSNALTSPGEVDNFNLRHSGGWDDEGVPCEHDVEFGGAALQRLGDKSSAKRGYGVISACEMTGEEAFAIDVTFTCPNN